METTVKIQFTEEEYNRIKEIVKQAVQEVWNECHKTEHVFATRKEVKEHLHISYPTLNKLSNEGLLIRHYIGGRVLYKWDEIKRTFDLGVKFIK